jgi:hypothetical protein
MDGLFEINKTDNRFNNLDEICAGNTGIAGGIYDSGVVHVERPVYGFLFVCGNKRTASDIAVVMLPEAHSRNNPGGARSKGKEYT